MQLHLKSMRYEDAVSIQSWRYKAPYTNYNMADNQETLKELLDPRSPYYTVWNSKNEMIGFFAFGTAATVGNYGGEPRIWIDGETEKKTTAIGLGLRPDLTGQGQGLNFVQAGITFAQQTFAPKRILLYVYAWNKRAITVYERTGLLAIRTVPGKQGDFLEMSLE